MPPAFQMILRAVVVLLLKRKLYRPGIFAVLEILRKTGRFFRPGSSLANSKEAWR